MSPSFLSVLGVNTSVQRKYLTGQNLSSFINQFRDYYMKLTKTLLTSALLATSIFSFQSTAWADTPEQQFQQGLESVNKGDYQTAIKLWKPLAEQGSASAQFNLGLMYSKGYGVKQDYTEAAKWNRKAAEQGDADAQFRLGVMYTLGKGVKKDRSEAEKWYRKAAEQGNIDAQNAMGEVYLSGIGVKQNDAEAVKWYRKAAEQGSATAQHAMGLFYSGTFSVDVIKEDLSKAKEWFRKACDNGSQYACDDLRKLEK